MIIVPVVPMSTLQEVADLARVSFCPTTGLARVRCYQCGNLQVASNERISVYHDFQCFICGITNSDIFVIPDMAQVFWAGRLWPMTFYSN